MANCERAISIVVCVSLVVSSMGLDGCKKETQGQKDQPPSTTYAMPTPDQLYQLVAPIALFPDNLVAQVLAASTYPDQVTEAWQWLQQNNSLNGQQRMQAADQQNWDVSVKGLTQFSDVLQQMATNLSWTSALGDAYFNAPQNVMNAVQVMRQRAYQAGNLKTTPQQNVTVQNQPAAAEPAPASSGEEQQVIVVQSPPQTIVIQPSQPEVVYVPTYNPTAVYGAPVPAYPGYDTGAMVATGLLSFGLGIAVGAAMNNNCCGWGWNSWGCGWNNSSVTYNRNVYVSNSNTFVNRNNYNNRNTINNVNRNDINRARVNNPNRGNINSAPQFDQRHNQPQYRDQGRGNMAQQRSASQPDINARDRGGRNQPAQGRINQTDRQSLRGYGDQPSRGAGNAALGNYGQGGNARANSARGQQSLNGGQNAAARGGGGGNRSGGGASRGSSAGASNRSSGNRERGSRR